MNYKKTLPAVPFSCYCTSASIAMSLYFCFHYDVIILFDLGSDSHSCFSCIFIMACKPSYLVYSANKTLGCF